VVLAKGLGECWALGATYHVLTEIGSRRWELSDGAAEEDGHVVEVAGDGDVRHRELVVHYELAIGQQAVEHVKTPAVRLVELRAGHAPAEAQVVQLAVGPHYPLNMNSHTHDY
jgi:hypothetical protein